MTIHASKSRFAKWESIAQAARLAYAYNNALLLRGHGHSTAECAQCLANVGVVDSPTVHTSYGGTD